MTAALVVLTMIGSFSLARWYGMLPALGAIGASFLVFAWLPQFTLTVGPIILIGVAGLIGLALLRRRNA